MDLSVGLIMDLVRRALDRGFLTLLPRLQLLLELSCGLRVRNLRQPRIEPRDGVVELAGDALFTRHIAARLRLRNLFDLAGDRIQPLMDVGDVPARARRHRTLLDGVAEIRGDGLADGGIEPVVQRHAGPARGGLGPVADGWIDAVDTPRYARIHASVRFRSGAPTRRLQPPRASRLKRQSNSARVVCH